MDMPEEWVDTWSTVSAAGVPAPVASPALPDVEAYSPARRSPNVRAAQRDRNRRPDLLPRQWALTP